MNYIIDPVSLKSIPLYSNKGKSLLKKYVVKYTKSGGGEINVPLKQICKTALYNKKAPDNTVDIECKVDNYMNNLEKSIESIKQSKNISDTSFVEDIATTVADLIQNKTNQESDQESDSHVIILGPVEDILGFMIMKHKNQDEFKYFILLSVTDETWSTDFNYDFINCSIKSGNNDDAYFEKLNNTLPIVLINTGQESLLENHNPEEILHKIPRVTQCEIQWISEIITNDTYEWEAKQQTIGTKNVWIHLLNKKQSSI